MLDTEMKERLLKAKQLAGGTYVNKDTKGTAIVKRVFVRKGFKGKAVIFEFEVEASEKQRNDGIPNKKGDDFNALYKPGAEGVKGEMAMNNIKTIALAAIGKNEGEVSDEELDELYDAMFSEVNVLRGWRIAYDTTDSSESKNRQSFPRFYSAGGNDEKSVAARRADLDKRKPVSEKAA
jgi:hypothetical protein